MRCKGGWSGPIVVACMYHDGSRAIQQCSRADIRLLSRPQSSPSYLQIRFRGRNFFPLLKYRTIFLEENLTRFQDRFQINYYRKLNINEALFQYLNQLISFFVVSSRQFFSLELSPVTVEIRIHKSSKGRREGSSVRWISIARPTESRNCFDAEEMQRSYVAFKFVLRFPPFPSPFRCSSASQPTSFVSAGLR